MNLDFYNEAQKNQEELILLLQVRIDSAFNKKVEISHADLLILCQTLREAIQAACMLKSYIKN